MPLPAPPFPRLIVAALSLLAVLPPCSASDPSRSLFNGRDLEGWESYLAKPSPSTVFPGEKRNAKGEHAEALGVGHDPTNVFTVVKVDGAPAIRISGEIFGTLTSKESFSNYRLRLEMRWGEKKWPPRLDQPRDGGLLYHAKGPWGSAGAWLPSLELQIQEGDLGDFWGVNARATIPARPLEKDWIYDPPSPERLFSQELGFVRRCIKLANHERPRGEWNTVEVACFENQSWHIVNGVVVMRLKQLGRRDGDVWQSATSGRVQLQSEGAEWFIRSITLQPIREVPADLR